MSASHISSFSRPPSNFILKHQTRIKETGLSESSAENDVSNDGFLFDSDTDLEVDDEGSNRTEGLSEEDIFKYKQSTSCLNTTGDDHIVIDIRTRQENKQYYEKKGLQPKCSIKSDEVSPSSYKYCLCFEIFNPPCLPQFVMYYFTLLFLLCFATPVLITTSLNVYISSAVRGTVYSNISNHQWLTLAACVLMWLPCLTERMLSKMGLLADRLSVSVFLFLLGHTHNLLR